MTDRERDGGAGLSPIEEVIADAAAGKLFILVDDEDRENEGDLCVIGEWADASAITFMAKHGRGLICLALTRARTEARPVLDGTAQRKPPPDCLYRVDRGARRGDNRHFGW